MPKGRALAGALLGILFFIVWAGEARAQRVALVYPNDSDAVLVDAFNRLRAELHLHDFEALVVDADVRNAVSARLAEIAQSAGALACIAFLREDGKTSVDVWLADRVSGKTTMRSIEVRNTSDASSVLAIRAVDLLRASFREVEIGERPPPDVVGVDRGPLPAVVRELAAPPAPTLTLRAEAVMLVDRPHLGAVFGPSVGVLDRVTDRLEIGLAAAGPLVGTSFHASRGSASVRQDLGWLEGRVSLIRSRRFEAGFNIALGAHHLHAAGQADPPLTSRDDDVWSAAGALGAHAQLDIAWRVAIAASVRGFVLSPRPGVELADDRVLFDFPVLGASIGLLVGL